MYEEVNSARKVVVETLGQNKALVLDQDGEKYVNVKALDALVGAVGMTGIMLVQERGSRAYGALIKMGYNVKALADLAHGRYTVENYRAEDNPPMPGEERLNRLMEADKNGSLSVDDIIKELRGSEDKD
jgi:hypothetical protein